MQPTAAASSASGFLKAEKGRERVEIHPLPFVYLVLIASKIGFSLANVSVFIKIVGKQTSYASR
jgi:hypothetical protein